MNEKTILNLWSANKTLKNGYLLSEQEVTALKELLDTCLGKELPTPREISRYKECKELIKDCKTDIQKDYFLPTIESFEKKYPIFK